MIENLKENDRQSRNSPDVKPHTSPERCMWIDVNIYTDHCTFPLHSYNSNLRGLFTGLDAGVSRWICFRFASRFQGSNRTMTDLCKAPQRRHRQPHSRRAGQTTSSAISCPARANSCETKTSKSQWHTATAYFQATSVFDCGRAETT